LSWVYLRNRLERLFGCIEGCEVQVLSDLIFKYFPKRCPGSAQFPIWILIGNYYKIAYSPVPKILLTAEAESSRVITRVGKRAEKRADIRHKTPVENGKRRGVETFTRKTSAWETASGVG
jgi:hypothetical protein